MKKKTTSSWLGYFDEGLQGAERHVPAHYALPRTGQTKLYGERLASLLGSPAYSGTNQDSASTWFFFFFWFVVRFNSKLLMPSALHILRCVLSSCFCRRCVIWSWKANRAIDGVSFQISHGYSSWHDVLDKTAFCVRYVVPVPASLPEALTDTVDHWTQTLLPDPISTVKEEEPSLSTSSAKAPKPKRARGAKS